MTRIEHIADALAAELNAGSFSQTLDAQRKYLARNELKEMRDLHVTVVAKSWSATAISRTGDQIDYDIDIGIQKKLGSDEKGEADAIMALVKEIAVFLNRRRLAAAPDVTWVSMTNDPIYSVDHFDQFRQLTSVLTVTYREME